jgi:hypothetical protein
VRNVFFSVCTTTRFFDLFLFYICELCLLRIRPNPTVDDVQYNIKLHTQRTHNNTVVLQEGTCKYHVRERLCFYSKIIEYLNHIYTQ